ncbi:MAG: hypothetical protein ACLQNE_36260 [Thermoguttaceae bacterium]
MKRVVKKFSRFLIWGLAILLTLYVVVKLADYCWHRAHFHIGFHSAKWTWKWDTEQYLGTMGRLLVRMPDPFRGADDCGSRPHPSW